MITHALELDEKRGQLVRVCVLHGGAQQRAHGGGDAPLVDTVADRRHEHEGRCRLGLRALPGARAQPPSPQCNPNAIILTTISTV